MASSLATAYRITDGSDFRLAQYDSGDTAGLESRKKARKHLAAGIERMAELQDRLYADSRWSLLLVFQAMDAAGKDSTIKHVMSGINPQGCQVHSFKQPSAEELEHDFLWRCVRRLPERGRIGIFNRSYYEEVLVAQVHPELLDRQQLPRRPAGHRFWRERYESICGLERHLDRNGTAIRKFFLHVGPEEQKRRFLRRIDDPHRNWKFSAADLAERAHWDDYQHAYQQAIRATATANAPWYVIPADHKWFARLVVAEVIVAALQGMRLRYPELGPEQRAELDGYRSRLLEDT